MKAQLRTEDCAPSLHFSEIANQKLHAILGGISDPFLTLDKELRYTFVNRRAAEMAGRKASELVGHGMLELFPEARGSELYQALEQVLKTNQSHSTELYWPAPEMWLDLQIYPSDEGLSVYARDVTSRKKAQAELEKSQRLLSDAQAMAHIGSWELNVATGEVVGSDEFYRIFGLERAAAPRLQSEFTKYVHPEDRERIAEESFAAFRRNENFALDYRVVRPDGELRYVHSRGHMEADSTGRLIHSFGTLQDITERKLTENRLEENAKELARSNAELERFAYIASHDLQEPLRMVASYVQLLQRRYQGKLDSDADEFIGFAVEGVTRMKGLINDLLTYSRVGSKGGQIKPVSASAACQRALLDLSLGISESGACVTCGELPVVRADEVQLVQLFQNLIGNALKFRANRPPRVNVSAERTGEEWTFRVADNGIGIESEFFNRIFVLFQRLHGPGQYPGTGIGLALCKKIIERHGGRIWVDSQPGEGSTFSFTLPAADA